MPQWKDKSLDLNESVYSAISDTSWERIKLACVITELECVNFYAGAENFVVIVFCFLK